MTVVVPSARSHDRLVGSDTTSSSGRGLQQLLYQCRASTSILEQDLEAYFASAVHHPPVPFPIMASGTLNLEDDCLLVQSPGGDGVSDYYSCDKDFAALSAIIEIGCQQVGGKLVQSDGAIDCNNETEPRFLFS
jgi:hypothetical protein